MSQTLLVIVYLGLGVALAGVELGRGPLTAERAGSALLALALWPLWAPFALTRVEGERGPITRRIAGLLDELSAASSDAPCAIEAREAAHILRQVAASERRASELDRRLSSLAAPREPPADGSLGELRRSARDELAALRDHERQALGELLELCEILRDRRELSRHAPGALGEARDDLRARVQALREI